MDSICRMLFTAGMTAAFSSVGAGGPSASPDAAASLKNKVPDYYAIRSISAERDRLVLAACRADRQYVVILGRDTAPVVETEIGPCPEKAAGAPLDPPAASARGAEQPAAPGVRAFAYVRDEALARAKIATTEKSARIEVAAPSQDLAQLGEPQKAPRPAYELPRPPDAKPAPVPDAQKSVQYTHQELQLFLRRSGYSHVLILIAEAPIYLAEGCQKGRRWRIAVDRRGIITDTEDVGPCFKKFLGVGIDDLQGAIHWLVGCESSGDGLSLYTKPSLPRPPRGGSFDVGAASKPQTVGDTRPVPAKPKPVTLPEPRSVAETPATAGTYGALGYWRHNGSLINISANGDTTTIAYAEPRPALLKWGVQTGTVLFRGRTNGRTLVGTAYVVAPRCVGTSYELSGDLSDPTRIKLSGRRPRLNSNCEPVGYVQEILIFERIPTQVAEKV